MASGLYVVPMTFAEAVAFVKSHHRHHAPPLSHLFSIGAAKAETIVGVAIVSRPVARMSQDGLTCEVTRLATDGTRNACSFLYRAAWKVASALGYRRLVTYTLASEPGTSLRAARFTCLGERGGGSWSRASRPRVDVNPTQLKMGWEIRAEAKT